MPLKSVTAPVRFEPYYVAGVRLAINKAVEFGWPHQNRTTIVKAGLMMLLDEYEITADDIHAEVMKEETE